MARLTDLQILRILLRQDGGKLSAGETRAFQQMYDQVASGQVIQLSRKQRAWLDQVLAKLKEGGRLGVGTRRVEVRDKQMLWNQPSSREFGGGGGGSPPQRGTTPSGGGKRRGGD